LLQDFKDRKTLSNQTRENQFEENYYVMYSFVQNGNKYSNIDEEVEL
jgi:hypothetical protein